MASIDVSVLHETLTAAGIPVVTVRLTHEQKVELEFDGATEDQKAAAQAIVAASEQEAAEFVKILPPAVKTRAPKN